MRYLGDTEHGIAVELTRDDIDHVLHWYGWADSEGATDAHDLADQFEHLTKTIDDKPSTPSDPTR
jgi:hypothetical protein